MSRERTEPRPERASGKEPLSRQERLAEALRANLRRRKTQRRARDEADAPSAAGRQETGVRT